MTFKVYEVWEETVVRRRLTVVDAADADEAVALALDGVGEQHECGTHGDIDFGPSGFHVAQADDAGSENWELAVAQIGQKALDRNGS